MSLSSKPVRNTLVVSAALFMLLALLALILVLSFDRIFLGLLAKNLAVLPGSPVYTNWIEPSVPIYFKVFLYNVTNVNDVLAGARPHLQQVGPFVYRETRQRFDVNFTKGEKTVRFKHRIFYHFQPEMSVALPETMNITSPDLFYLALLSRQSTGFASGHGPFITLTAQQIMWGYYPALLDFLISFGLADDSKVGLFARHNGTAVNEFIINTGAENIKEIGQIYEVNGEKSMNIWDTDDANVINGTDGSLAPPGLTIGSTITVHVPDICRSVTSYAVGKTSTVHRDDIDVIVFSGAPPDPSDPLAQWRTKMFCPKDKGCPPRGLVALERCIAARQGTGLPMFLSMPYFLDADPAISAPFDGLPVPNHEDHATWVHIEPTTGFVLEAFKRIQFNIYMENVDSSFKQMAGPFYFPLGWLEEVAVADKPALDMLHNQVLSRRQKMPFLLSIVGAVATLLSVLCIIVLITCVRSRTTSRRVKRGATVSPTTPMIGGSIGSTKEAKLDSSVDVIVSPWTATIGDHQTQVVEAKPLIHPPRAETEVPDV